MSDSVSENQVISSVVQPILSHILSRQTTVLSKRVDNNNINIVFIAHGQLMDQITVHRAISLPAIISDRRIIFTWSRLLGLAFLWNVKHRNVVIRKVVSLLARKAPKKYIKIAQISGKTRRKLRQRGRLLTEGNVINARVCEVLIACLASWSRAELPQRCSRKSRFREWDLGGGAASRGDS